MKSSQTIKSAGPNTSKTLKIEEVEEHKLRLTITTNSFSSTIIVLDGDLNGALAVLGHDPAQG